MKLKSKAKGVTLVNVMMATVIMGLVLPVVYGTLMNSVVFAIGSRLDVDLQGYARTAMQRVVQDVKSSRAVIDEDYSNPGALIVFKQKYLPNAVNDTRFTVNSDELAPTDPDYAKKIAGNSLLLMNYIGRSDIGLKKVDTFRLVCYYMEESRDLSSEEFNKLMIIKKGVPRKLMRLESHQKFVDPTILTLVEKELAENNGYILWTPPVPGTPAKLPAKADNLTFVKVKIATNIAPGSGNTPESIVSVNQIKSPPAGGVIFSRNKNLVDVTVLTMGLLPKGFKTYSMQTQASARNIY